MEEQDIGKENSLAADDRAKRARQAETGLLGDVEPKSSDEDHPNSGNKSRGRRRKG